LWSESLKGSDNLWVYQSKWEDNIKVDMAREVLLDLTSVP